MTTNSQFLNKNRKSRENNRNEVLNDPILKFISQSGQKVGIDEISRLLSAINTKPDLGMDMVAAEEAFDNMNAYYEVALNLFTDNVPTLAIQGPIIREVPKLFCPTAVFSMEADVIKRIAGETDEKMRERDEILQRLQTLESGARICKLYAKRPQPLSNTARERNNASELPENGRQATETSFGKAHSKAPSTPKHFPESVPNEGMIKNPFNHISSLSQTETPRSKSSKPTLFGDGTPKPFAGPGTSVVEPTSSKLKTSSPPASSSTWTFADPKLLARDRETPITQLKSTTGTIFESFEPLEVAGSYPTLNKMMDLYCHISSMPKFQNFSCEELRLADYELLGPQSLRILASQESGTS